VQNTHVAVLEEGEEAVFLYRVEPGGADRSYGIHVARLAGIPRSVTRRAEELLHGLENCRPRRPADSRRTSQAPSPQLSLFAEPNPLLEELKSLDILSLTPMEALAKLFEFQQKARES
jgi:DNA mismatch repair protein MutS